jgi:hypothetical protein
VLEYHTKGIKSTNETKDMFGNYGLPGTPAVVFNGSRGEGTMVGPKPPATYQSRIDQLMGQKSNALITASINNGGDMAAAVELTNLSTKALENARLYAVVYEDLKTNDNHYVVRDITPVQEFTLAGHGTAAFTLESRISYSASKHMVIILKSTSGTILQSLFVI